MAKLILKDEFYKINGACVEVHRLPGMGFKEVVYKDALVMEFSNPGIPFTSENDFG